MKLMNYEIDAFTKLLYEMKLKGKESRMRTRLVKQLDEYSRVVIAVERNELITQYAKKDEHGEMVLKLILSFCIKRKSKEDYFPANF